ncbi:MULTISPECIES: hypothetical protein [unclassified Streptomyces]|uniref:hypothetical protein n=1 Tax=unclassified Streptomyces TaxID=2593676 RepID=UPI003442FA65
MPKPTPAWFDTLTASAHALGGAAREYRTAYQTVRTAAWNVDPTRVLPINGKLSVLERDFVRPQDDALWRLGELYGGLRDTTKRLYENTAQAYAYGTAAAVKSVLNGARPPHIELGRRDGCYVLPAGPLPDMRSALSRWTGSERLASLRQRVLEQECALAYVSDFAFYEDLADYECADLTHASERAAGLADSAYAYGETAESALHFVLLTAATSQASGGDR